MQYKGYEKAAKVVEFVAKWLNLCLSTVDNTELIAYSILLLVIGSDFEEMESKITSRQPMVFSGLNPASDYECRGEMKFDNQTFILPSQVFRTKDGVPESPEGPIAANVVLHDTANISWHPPKLTNGAITQYQVTLKPECLEAHNTGKREKLKIAFLNLD